jgi:hypothetical protein
VIAALFVDASGSYAGLPNVDLWDKERDARRYDGPFPVVAHPPCQRWGKMWMGSPGAIARGFARKEKGDDDGCFEAALNAVRKFGGILEHPERSHAWEAFGLKEPPRSGGWVSADFDGGWTCRIEQGFYGHWARKPTWLYAVDCDLPSLEWGITKWEPDAELVARIGLKKAKKLGEVSSRGGGTDSKARIGTPIPFRDLLISIAETANRLTRSA